MREVNEKVDDAKRHACSGGKARSAQCAQRRGRRFRAPSNPLHPTPCAPATLPFRLRIA